jgi:hypothetical protein
MWLSLRVTWRVEAIRAEPGDRVAMGQVRAAPHREVERAAHDAAAASRRSH